MVVVHHGDHERSHVPSHRDSRHVPEGVDRAITNGIRRAGETLRHLDWFEVIGIRGQITGTDASHYQVTMKVGFRLEDENYRVRLKHRGRLEDEN
ncbi:MAG: dodecin [Nocardioidaceae bacterium]